MNVSSFIYSSLFVIVTAIVILISIYIYKKYIANSYETIPFTDLVAILRFTIDGELHNYDKTVFLRKETITQSNLENFYADITSQIISSLPSNFYSQMSRYLTEEAVIKIICRDVRAFLIEKI